MATVNNSGNVTTVTDDNGNALKKTIAAPNSSFVDLYNEQATVGQTSTTPKPNVTGSKNQDLVNKMFLEMKDGTDKFAYARPSSYNSTHTGLNFDRYYNHSNFKKLGFSPYRDNETLYNDNSTWSQDFGRAMGQWGTLWSNGMSSIFKNWGTLASAAPDIEGSHVMEKAMAVGSSSKKGFGAGVTNFALNSAYTVGILTEIALEEIALAAATYASGGTAAPATIIRTGINLGRAGKAIKNIFRTGDSVYNARKIWNTAKKITPMGDFIDLGIGVAKADKRTFAGIRASQGGVDAFAQSKALFGQFYRDLREINAASAESKLEAGLVTNEVSDKLIRRFYDENGRMPNNNEAQLIYDRAQRAGAQTFLYNMPAIYFSNKIVIGTALKGIRPLRNIINKVPTSLRPIIKTVNGKKTAKIIDTSVFKTHFSKDYIKSLGKSLRPGRILGSGLRYTSANWTEGAQELFQESLSAGVIDHYTQELWNNERIAQADILNSLSLGMQVLDDNDMALETFLSGFLMASPVGLAQNLVFNKGAKAVQKYTNRKEYDAVQEQRKKQIENLEKSLNTILEDPAQFANAFYRNAMSQNKLAQEHFEAEEGGDIKISKDVQVEQLFNHVHTLMKHGMTDEFTGQLKDLLKLSDKELQEAFNEESIEKDVFNNTLRNRIEKAIKRTEEIEEIDKKYKESLQNPYDQTLEPYDYLAFEEARKFLVFNEAMHKDTGGRMASIAEKLSQNPVLSEILSGDIMSLFDTNLELKLTQIREETKAYKDATTPDQLKLKKEKEEFLKVFEHFYSTIQQFNVAYSELKNAGLNPETDGEFLSKFRPGTKVEYPNSNGTTTQGVFVGKMGNNLIIEIVNKAGKKQRVAVKLSNVVSIGNNTTAENEELTYDDAYMFLFEALFGSELAGVDVKGVEKIEGIIQYVAKTKNLDLTPDTISEIYSNIRDLLRLNSDKKTYVANLNKLSDPEYFSRSVEKFEQIFKTAHEISKAKVGAMLDDYEKIQAKHELLQKLFELGVFIDPENVESFTEKHETPSSFYTATDIDGIPALTLLNPADPTHTAIFKKIFKVLEKYEEANKVEFENKHLLNREGAGEILMRHGKDERTLADLVKEYGFKQFEDSSMSFKELLQKIINNNKSINSDKALAIRLLAMVKDDFDINFNIDQLLPVSHDSTNGVLVNPKYAANNYKGYYSFERLVLNGGLQKIVSDQLLNETYKSEMEKLMEQVKTFIKESTPEELFKTLKEEYNIHFDQDKDGNVIREMLMSLAGLRSVEQFVAEGLTNGLFQTLLLNVKIENAKAPSVFEQFLKFIGDALRKLTNYTVEGNALDKTLELLMASINNTEIKKTPEKAITINTPIKDMPEELQDSLKATWENLTDQERADYAGIEDWVKGNSEAAKIIKKYNVKHKRTVTEETPEENLPWQLLKDSQKTWLWQNSGLDKDQINDLDFDEAVEIADGRFRILEPEETISPEQLAKGRKTKLFLNQKVKMINVPIAESNIFESDKEIEKKLAAVSEKVIKIFSDAVGVEGSLIDGKPRVALLETYSDAVIKATIEQIEAIYKTKKLKFTDKSKKEMGQKIRLFLDPNANGDIMFRVTSLVDIVDFIKAGDPEKIDENLSEAIDKLLTENKGTQAMYEGADRGNVIDEFFRKVLMATSVPRNLETTKSYLESVLEDLRKAKKFKAFADMTFDDAFVEGLLKTWDDIASKMEKGNLRALTNINTLFGSVGKLSVSGELDILLYNAQGELFIVDLKTMKFHKSYTRDKANYDDIDSMENWNGKDSASYVRKDTFQLNIYRHLIEQLVGDKLKENDLSIKGLGVIGIYIKLDLEKGDVGKLSKIELKLNIHQKDTDNAFYMPVHEMPLERLAPELFFEAQQFSELKPVLHDSTLRKYKVIYIGLGLTVPEEIREGSDVFWLDNYFIEQIKTKTENFIGKEDLDVLDFGEWIVNFWNNKDVINKTVRSQVTGILTPTKAEFEKIIEDNAKDKVVLTQSKVFTNTLIDEVDLAILSEDFSEGFQKNTLLREYYKFGQKGVMAITDEKNLSEVLTKDLSKLRKTKNITSFSSAGQSLEEWIESATTEQLFHYTADIESLDDDVFGLSLKPATIKKHKGKQTKDIAKILITEAIQARYSEGITKADDLPKNIEDYTLVVMENTELYPRGLGFLTPGHNVKAVYIEESKFTNGSFETFGAKISKTNKLIGILGVSEFEIVDPSVNPNTQTTPEADSEIQSAASDALGQQIDISEFTNENITTDNNESSEDWSNLGSECK